MKQTDKDALKPTDAGASVVVVVPVYKPSFSEKERTSLDSILSVLQNRDIVIVKPEGLYIPSLPANDKLRQKEFDPSFFKGIRGYNRLMTDAAFYDSFAEYDYMLIAQLDTFIFRDELDGWCARGYDYVGAPWLKRTINKYPPFTWLKAIGDRRRRRKGLYSKVALYDKVGNGGLSLRKIKSFSSVCRECREELLRINDAGPKGYPEDVFWAQREGFRYPTAKQALGFAFDKYPRLCYSLNDMQLPMGCHGWYSRKMRRFWSKFIPGADS